MLSHSRTGTVAGGCSHTVELAAVFLLFTAGRYNTHMLCNRTQCLSATLMKLPLTRKLSGNGTVPHDTGNVDNLVQGHAASVLD